MYTWGALAGCRRERAQEAGSALCQCGRVLFLGPLHESQSLPVARKACMLGCTASDTSQRIGGHSTTGIRGCRRVCPRHPKPYLPRRFRPKMGCGSSTAAPVKAAGNPVTPKAEASESPQVEVTQPEGTDEPVARSPVGETGPVVGKEVIFCLSGAPMTPVHRTECTCALASLRTLTAKLIPHACPGPRAIAPSPYHRCQPHLAPPHLTSGRPAARPPLSTLVRVIRCPVWQRTQCAALSMPDKHLFCPVSLRPVPTKIRDATLLVQDGPQPQALLVSCTVHGRGRERARGVSWYRLPESSYR
jgi:hypothetical protein